VFKVEFLSSLRHGRITFSKKNLNQVNVENLANFHPQGSI